MAAARDAQLTSRQPLRNPQPGGRDHRHATTRRLTVSTARDTGEAAQAMAVASAVGALDENPARLLYAPENTRYGDGNSRGRERSRPFPRVDDSALLERLRTLRSILPALATEVA